MKNLPLLIGTLVATVVLVVGVAVFFSPQTEPKTVELGQLVGDSRLAKGATESAQVTIVEFSDFQCPACRAIQPLVTDVLTAYPSQVKFVYRHYPLIQIHQHALLAAQASEVSAETGKFWEFHDLLFEKQAEWSVLKSSEAVKTVWAEYAAQLGIDKVTFLERIDSEEIKQRVAADVSAGNAIKIQSTPSFFVNGQLVTAPQQLKSTVESFLK